MPYTTFSDDDHLTGARPTEAVGPPAPPRIRPDQVAVSHRFDVCDGKGDSIAHVVVHERAGSLWLSDLWVHPEHRRRGIARLLMTQAVGAFADKHLWLNVSPYTDRAASPSDLASFYASFGFAAAPVPGVMTRPSGPLLLPF